jgi:DNA-binding SARP family transcriptional activator
VVDINIDQVHLNIETLGGFAIICGENRLTEQVKKSSKVWKLIQYLIAHRHKSVPQDELMEKFCDDEAVGNPGSALRTMVYRARAALAKGGLPFADDVILAKSGGYAWNNAIQCVVDAEELDRLSRKANATVDEKERLELLLQATALYRADFLPNSSGEMWVISLARWYRSIYMSCVHGALELLSGAKRNDEAEELCSKALQIDPFDEKILEHHLRSLMAQGKNMEALEEYKRMESMFFDVLGVNFSENLRTLYANIQHPQLKAGISLEAMLENWSDGADFPGAFYCDLSVFKTLFQIESRSVPRSGRTAYIVRFDTKHEPGVKGGGVMKQLGLAIPHNLRMGDLFTRASPHQYILMLHSLTYEDCKMLIDRIMHELDAKYLTKVIGHSIKPVIPIFDASARQN